MSRIVGIIGVTGDGCYAPGVFPAAINALTDGRLNHEVLKEWITARVPLEELEKSWFDELEMNKSKQIKVLVRVSDTWAELV